MKAKKYYKNGLLKFKYNYLKDKNLYKKYIYLPSGKLLCIETYCKKEKLLQVKYNF